MANNLPSHFDHYQVLQLLGGGSFGEVYLVKDTHLQRQVVLKVLRPYLAQQPDMVRRFMREARAMAKVKHANIVMVHGVGQTPPYIVMEYVQGSSLADYLSQKGANYFGEAAHRDSLLAILRQIADGLDAAHQQQMVHRDVKPANVLIDLHGQVKVTDFGLVKFLQGGTSMMGNSWGVAGTVLYMAPEQADSARQGEIGAASDIYALGVMSYEMLAGRVPFSGNNNFAIMDAHRRSPPPDPRQFNPQLPVDVVDVLMKALDKQPSNRYPTATAFVTALAEASQGQSTPSKLAKRRQHSRILVSALAMMAFLLLLTIVMLIWTSIKKPPPIQEASFPTQTAEALVLSTPEDEEATEIAIPLTHTPLPTPLTPPSAPIPPTEPPTQTEEVTMKMLLVPAGEFLMGSTEDDPDANEDEFPQHPVYLDAFEIDETEVTNQMYRACVEAAVCTSPTHEFSSTRESYYDNPQYNDYPVIWVLWRDATTYCQWVGKRLPTEAEWEKAAGGTDSRKYPWGNNLPDESLANIDYYVDDTTSVGSYPAGASPYGALDMAGNVWEWVNDSYDASYYASSPKANPQGAESQPDKVIRGGSWLSSPSYSRVRARYSYEDAYNVGFRCARSR